MLDDALSVREFVAVTSQAYPVLTIEADQWHEYGYFYDPIENVYAAYSIDRKDQVDDVERFATAAELLAARGGDERLASWLGSFQVWAPLDERVIYFPESRTVRRIPVAAATTMTVDQALERLDGYALAWLREHLD
jgi:hypothetical protein